MERRFEASPMAERPDARQAALLAFATVCIYFAIPEGSLKLVVSWKNSSGPVPGALRQREGAGTCWAEQPGDGACDSSVALTWCSSTG